MRGWKVTLAKDELEMCERVGQARWDDAIRKNRDPGGGSTRQTTDARNHIRGARAEFAVSQALNLSWRPTIGRLDAPDVGQSVQVRSTDRLDYRLFIKPKDADDDPFVLAYTPDNCSFILRGWFLCCDAKARYPAQKFGERDQAHIVPTEHLRDMGVLYVRCHATAILARPNCVEVVTNAS